MKPLTPIYQYVPEDGEDKERVECIPVKLDRLLAAPPSGTNDLMLFFDVPGSEPIEVSYATEFERNLWIRCLTTPHSVEVRMDEETAYAVTFINGLGAANEIVLVPRIPAVYDEKTPD